MAAGQIPLPIRMTTRNVASKRRVTHSISLSSRGRLHTTFMPQANLIKVDNYKESVVNCILRSTIFEGHLELSERRVAFHVEHNFLVQKET